MANIQEKEINIIYKNVKKHKKAIIYSFFESFEEVSIVNIEITKSYKEYIQAIITLDNGRKIIYKSCALEYEKGFQKYISWLNQNVFQDRKMYCKNILLYKECGFVEYIDERKCEDEEKLLDYYYRLGGLKAVLGTLNVVATEECDIIQMGEQPIVKDFDQLINKTSEDKMKLCNSHGKKDLSEIQLQHYINGYQDVLDYVRKHESDIEEIIKISFGNTILYQRKKR